MKPFRRLGDRPPDTTLPIPHMPATDGPCFPFRKVPACATVKNYYKYYFPKVKSSTSCLHYFFLHKHNLTERREIFTLALTTRECFEEETVSLSCEVNKEGLAVSWFKNGSILVPMEGLHIEREGTLHRLIIDRAELSQSGTYTASIMKGVETSAQLLVLGMKYRVQLNSLTYIWQIHNYRCLEIDY